MTPGNSRINADSASAPARRSSSASPRIRTDRSLPCPRTEVNMVAWPPWGREPASARSRSAIRRGGTSARSSAGASSQMSWPVLASAPTSAPPSSPPAPSGNRCPTITARFWCGSRPCSASKSCRTCWIAASSASTTSAVAAAVEPGGSETWTRTASESNGGAGSTGIQRPRTRPSASASDTTPRATVAPGLSMDQRSAGR